MRESVYRRQISGVASVDALSQITNSKSVNSCASTLSIASARYRAVLYVGMQTLTFGSMTFQRSAVSSQPSSAAALSYLFRHSLAALYRFEAPVITPLAESPARVKANAFHPTVNRPQAWLAIEIEHDIGVWDVNLIRDHDVIRAL